MRPSQDSWYHDAVSIPEFPESYYSQLPATYLEDRKPLKRSTSFDSSEELSHWLKRDRMYHGSLQCDINRYKYRTLAAEKGPDGGVTYWCPLLPERTVSSDHLFEAYLREQKDSERRRLIENPESTSHAKALEFDEARQRKLNEARRRRLNDGLCERCRMINIERLLENGGYTHSTLDAVHESSRSCPLCKTFCMCIPFLGRDWVYTLDRYELTISPQNLDTARIIPGHSGVPDSEKCIWIGLSDTRPWEPWEGPEDGRKRAHMGGSEMMNRSVKPREEENRLPGTGVFCYTEEGDQAMYAGFPWLRENIEHTGSSGSLRIAKGWLEQCLATDGLSIAHGVGSQGVESPAYDYDSKTSAFPAERPTRLLEILVTAGPDDKPRYSVRLIKTEGRDYIYTALSYCWGEAAGPWLTSHDTIQQHLRGIDFGSLPATIKDCVHITATLGVSHVWIDALCIIQSSASDWELESAKMGGIYKGALLTIAASRSARSDDGCFSRKRTFKDPFAGYTCVESQLKNGETSRLFFEPMPGAKSFHVSPALFDREVYSSPLSQRAWAYQERVLSRRMLYFGETQLHWECDHCRLSQDNSLHEQEQLTRMSLNFKEPMDTRDIISRWYEHAVEMYSMGRLTNPTDRLVAISAVAKATYLNRHVKYVAGLWKDCILEGLCWARYSSGRKNQAIRCPSWSWASQQSAVRYRQLWKDPLSDGDDHGRAEMLKILDVQVAPSEMNPFGDVHSGSITCLARLAAGTVMPDGFGLHGPCVWLDFTFPRTVVQQSLFISEKCGHRIWHGLAVMDDDEPRFQKVDVALVKSRDSEEKSWILLLIEKIDKKEHVYRRVGLGVLEEDYKFQKFRRDKHWKPNFERDWTEHVITIV